MDRSALRRALRRARRALTPQQQHVAAIRLKRRLANTSLFRRAKRMAFYRASDGEISPAPLMQQALATGKTCYLPVLHPVRHNRLWFVRYQPGCRMRVNRFGIEEPDPRVNPRITPRALDLILLPLVGFDPQGGRLGMGGGFYDRTLAFKRGSPTQRPRLIGLAHELQKVEQLELASWDIPLATIATEQQIYRAAQR